MEAYKVEFRIWADSAEEAAALSASIQSFINEHGAHGRAVTARKTAQAIAKWKDNMIVRNRIIKYFEND